MVGKAGDQWLVSAFSPFTSANSTVKIFNRKGRRRSYAQISLAKIFCLG